MTTIRPPRRTSPADTGARHRPGTVVVRVRRLFGVDGTDVMVVSATTIFLVIFGLVMVLSSSSVTASQGSQGDAFAVVARQAWVAIVGIPLMLIIARLPAVFWRKWSRLAVMVALGLQLLVFTGLGYGYGGNQNWISVGGFTAQPSEFVKFALVIWLATVLADRADGFIGWKDVLVPAVPVSLVAIGMVLLGQDLGTASVMVMIVLAALFVAGAPLTKLTVMAGAVLAAAVLFAFSSSSRSNRITVWLSGCAPEDYEGICWQSAHALWALGSGGIFGQGLGNSAAKWRWLPHAESDFIFAIIGEELGLLGALLVLTLYTVLAVALIRLILSHRQPFHRIATGAVLAWIIGQAFVNIAVVLGLLPVLGVPLPFISSGGSALLASLVAIGMVLSLARSRGRPSVSAP